MAKAEPQQSAQRKICLVITPFGAVGSTEFQERLSIFENLIQPVCKEMGYEAIRSDTDQKNSGIIKKIVADLSTADLVIADISDAGASTMWELGVRHALRRVGTILLRREGSKDVFDLSGYPAVMYAAQWHHLHKAKADLKSHIARKHSAAEETDSPVFEHLTEQARILDVNDPKYAQLLEENRALTERLAEVSNPLGDNRPIFLPASEPSHSMDHKFEQAEKHREMHPKQLAREFQRIDKTDHDAFIAAVKAKLSSRELASEASFETMRDACRDREEYEIELLVAEEWLDRVPESRDATQAVASALLRSNKLLEKSALMIAKLEGILGVTTVKGGRSDGGCLGKASDIPLLRQLTDLYEFARASERTLELIRLLKPKIAQDPRIRMNEARAIERSGDFEIALTIYKEVCDQDVGLTLDQARTWYAFALIRKGDLKLAFEYFEQAIVCGKRDASLYATLAMFIRDTLLIRQTDALKVVSGDFDQADRQAFALIEYVYVHLRDQEATIAKLMASIDKFGNKAWAELTRRLESGTLRPDAELIRDCPSLRRILAQSSAQAQSEATPVAGVPVPSGRRRSTTKPPA